MARDFHTLKAWQVADELAVEVYRISKQFPKEERFGLTGQIRSAAVSVAANLAEGSGRETFADFRRFVFVAQGSLSEVEYYIHLAHRLAFLDLDGHDILVGLRDEAGRTVSGLISWLNRQPKKPRSRLGNDLLET